MRKLFAIALAVGLFAPLAAQEPKTARPEVTLRVGDAAPPLKHVQWLQGDEVKSWSPGHVYVVEFWATWCGPCIVMMPHMSDMQQEFKGKATFISFTTIDKQNPQDKVAAFIEKRGPKLKYTFAASDKPDTNETWMRAAGRNGIPCCFVIDKESKIAFIGHPMYLDVVLPKVLSGKWNIKEDGAAVEKIEQEVSSVFKSFSGDAESALKTIGEFEKNHPELASIPYFTGPKLSMMMKSGKTKEAATFAEQVFAKATKADDSSALQSLSAALRGTGGPEANKELLGLSVKAAEAAVKITGEKDAIGLYYLAEAYFAAGDKAKAKEYAAKTLAGADSEQLKAALERQLKKFDEEKKDK